MRNGDIIDAIRLPGAGPRAESARRLSLSASNVATSVPASATALQTLGAQVAIPKFAPPQALKILACSAILSDANATGKLTMVSASIQVMAGNQDKALREYQPNYAPVLLGATGVRWGFEEDEWIFATDYREVIPAVDFGNVQVLVLGDITNSDGASAHNLNTALTILYEIADVLPLKGF